MHITRHFLPAAVIAAALQTSAWLAPAAAQPLSPDVAYHAPSWWITAVVKGQASTLLSGNPQADQRLRTWLVGFGHGFASRCAATQGPSGFEAILDQEIAQRPAMRVPGQKGIEDGQRFAELNGCTSEAATTARQTVAGIRASFGSEQPAQPRQTAAANRATIINRSGLRIYAVQMSEESDPNWGRDRLGDRLLLEDQAIELPLESRSCIFDVRVVYIDGRAEERRGINLCSQSQLTFDGSGARAVQRPQNDQSAAVSDDRNRRSFQ